MFLSSFDSEAVVQTTEKLRVLLVGLGSIGQRHARNLRALLGDRVELSAYRVRGLNHVITPQLTLQEGTTPQFEYGLSVFWNWDDALASRPQVVFITNPYYLHIEFALSAARAGCHLFIEKPLSHSMDGVRELKSVVKEKQLVAFVGYQLRFHPGYLKLKALLSENTLGRLTSVHHSFGEYLPNCHPYEDYRRYHAARSDQGGGVSLSQIHDLDCLYGLFGLPSRLVAFGGQRSDLEIDVEDTVDVLMEMGPPGRPFTVHLHQDCIQDPPRRVCEIVGTKGKIIWDYYAKSVQWFKLSEKNSENFLWDGFERSSLFLDELRHFLDCLKGDCQPIVSLDEAEVSLRIALAAKTSLESGAVIFL